MCGIVGIFGRSRPAPHQDRWNALVNSLFHRGPDEGAFWADGPFFLGHRRLSIIGLQSGGQPMATADGRLVVTFNGEIYNYLELRQELERCGHRFVTDSDTEVLLHGYREWGLGLPTRLTGMFAFALADRTAERLFLARDRFGEKPLFYWAGSEYFAFASELKALTHLPDLPRRLDQEALAGILALNYVPGQATLMENVRRLEPGCQMLVEKGVAERAVRYWSPPAESLARLDAGVALEEFRSRFDRAVALSLRSDVPVGVLLSGGIDSSLVAESAARQGRLSRAYLLDFGEKSYSERPFGEEVCRRLGLELRTVRLGSEAMREFVSLVDHADDPLADSSALAYRTVARLAAQTDKVVLGGDGGDELFGGYLTYQASLLHHLVVDKLPMSVRQALRRLSHRLPTTEGKVTLSFKLRRFLRAADLPAQQAHLTWNGAWSPGEAATLVRPELAEQVGQVLKRLAPEQFLGKVLELQRIDLDNFLPNDILTKGDRMSMSHGLEARSPFLEHELAQWALALPQALKLRGATLKYLLRRAARETFGSLIADRPKQGFSIPIHAWMRTPDAAVVRQFLEPEAVAAVGVFREHEIARVVDLHMSGKRSLGFELWGLAVISAWHHLRLETPPHDPPEHPLIRRSW